MKSKNFPQPVEFDTGAGPGAAFGDRQASDELALALQSARLSRRLPSPRRRRALRVASGLSQPAMARLMGTTSSAVCRWERGVRCPRGKRLSAYIEILERLAADQVETAAPRGDAVGKVSAS
ncbi:MAG: helix-turn-helix domain-containing protein [Vicinamibacterales bacterium]